MTSTQKENAGLLPSQYSSRYPEVSAMQAQKLQQLRINRVAIIQALRVEHILPNLMENQVFDEDDKILIMTPKKAQDKCRKLLDLLTQKGNSVDWYAHFRAALKSPDCRSSEAKRKYSMLLSFMDNTILPAGQCVETYASSSRASSFSQEDGQSDNMKLPRYEPLPGINSSDLMKSRSISRVTFEDNREPIDGESVMGDEKGTNEAPEHVNKEIHMSGTRPCPKYSKSQMTLIKGYFHKWIPAPENFSSLIEEPTEKFETLEASSDPSDKELLEKEKEALEKIRNIEIVFALDTRHQLPEGIELCMSSPADQLLDNKDIFHLYFKYFRQMLDKYNLDIPTQLGASYCNMVDAISDASDEELRENVTTMGFGLFDLLEQYGLYNKAEAVLSSMVQYLNTNPNLETWMAMWEGIIKLMAIRNTNVNFSEADQLYNASLRMAEKIKLMSFGQDLLDESQMYVQLSRMMREQGSIGPSYGWAQAAMKEVETNNHSGIIEVLCNATMAYAMNFNVKKAEILSIETVKFSRQYFGINHPLYVDALLNFCNYSNEFRQDSMGVEVARAALATVERIYGDVSTIHKALAHQALAKALIACHQFTDGEYFQHASDAWKIAMDVIPGGHARLAPFRYTLAQCLVWRASNEPADQKTGSLIWAWTEAKGALSAFTAHWGEYSIRAAQAHTLLGQIFAKMENPDYAEAALSNSFSLHKLVVSNKSNYLYLMKATLGTYYKSVDKPMEALDLLKEVVDDIDCGGVYLKWVHLCYDTLIDLYHSMDREEEADLYQAGLVDWMRKNPKPSFAVTWAQLHGIPQDWENFRESFDTFGTKVRSMKRGLKNLKENMQKINVS